MKMDPKVFLSHLCNPRLAGLAVAIPADYHPDIIKSSMAERLTDLVLDSSTDVVASVNGLCVTVIGAVSPAGGDFSEPVTQNSLRVAGCFWALDASLARARHFPSINWTRSYTTYRLGQWFDEHVAEDWSRLSAWAVRTLQEEGSLLEVVSLLGVEAVAAPQRVTLRVGRMLREDYLQQNSFDALDASCAPRKQVAMLRLVKAAEEAMTAAVESGRPVADVVAHPVLRTIAGARGWPADETLERHLEDAVATVRTALTTAPTTKEELR